MDIKKEYTNYMARQIMNLSATVGSINNIQINKFDCFSEEEKKTLTEATTYLSEWIVEIAEKLEKCECED